MVSKVRRQLPLFRIVLIVSTLLGILFMPSARSSARAVYKKGVTALERVKVGSLCTGGVDWFWRRRIALGPPPEPILQMSQKQQAANARVLLVTSDTRPLVAKWENRSYWGLSSALNRHYALMHGYDFAFVHTFTSSLPAGANLDEKDRACFHKGYVLWRVHNWCKVLTMWAAAQGARDPETGASLYDLIVYIDSDAIIQEVGADISEAWAAGMGKIVFGAPFCSASAADAAGSPLEGTSLAGCAVRDASVRDSIFFILSDNIIGDPGNPNMGFYIMRNEPRTLSMLRDWWDFVDPDKGHLYATYAFHEQTGMHRLMTRNTSTNWARAVTVNDARWAPDDQARLVRHINSEENRYDQKSIRGMRVDKFEKHWSDRGLSPDDYEQSISKMFEGCEAVDLDVLAIGDDIESQTTSRHDG